jgi:hypothetical protein
LSRAIEKAKPAATQPAFLRRLSNAARRNARAVSVHRAFITNPRDLVEGAEPDAPMFVVGRAMKKREEVLND